MAETITVPGMGKVEQKYVYGGLALTAGIVGYAWYRRGNSSSAGDVEIVPNPESIPDTDRTPVVGDSSGSWDTTDDDAITTNADWTIAAQDHLITTGGWTGSAIAVALGKYLDRKPLTEAEIEIVQAARASTGEPPQNGPYAIIPALPTGGTGGTGGVPAAVTQVTVTPGQPGWNTVQWTHDGKDVARFEITVRSSLGGTPFKTGATARNYAFRYTWNNRKGSGTRPFTATYTITPISATGKRGPSATATGHFK